MGKDDREVKKYAKLIKECSPPSDLFRNMIKAFLVGGTICVIAELIHKYIQSLGFEKAQASLITTITVIFLSIFLTALGVYDKIGKHAGAGTMIPITGFANAVSACALEFKKEGYILGVGAKIFILAGPVITYGTITSFLVGVIYYFLK